MLDNECHASLVFIREATVVASEFIRADVGEVDE
jgi:hypothetical protein